MAQSYSQVQVYETIPISPQAQPDFKRSVMLKVTAIPAFADNYIWCIINEHHKQAIVIDPGCSESVLDFLKSQALELIGILITHHHPDHIGGVADLKSQTEALVFGFSDAGPKNSKLTFIDQDYTEGDTFSLLGTEFQVIAVPGHTLDHIAFYSASDKTHNTPWLFCGDTLFSGGCGRLFEGSACQMQHSLGKLSSLPKETEVYCAHEYTLNNLEFSVSLMPNNEALRVYREECKAKRAKSEITLPSTIGLELKINPFLRTHDPELIQSLQSKNKILAPDTLSIFTATRKEKDVF